MSETSRGVRNLGILFDRNVRQMARVPLNLVFGLIMPFIQLGLFGTIFSASTDIPGNPYQGESYIGFILPVVVLTTTVLGMANMAASLLVDLRSGYFDKLRTTPATPWAIILSRMGAEMVRVVIQALMVIGLAVLMGATISTGIAGAVVMVTLSALVSGCAVGLLVSALALKTKSDQATQSFFPIFFLATFLTTAYQPENLLPESIRGIAVANPLNYVIVTLRGLVFDGWPVEGIAVIVGASLVFAVVLGALNVRVYRKLAA